MENKSFIKYPTELFDAIHSLSLTKYELKAIHLIIRATIGCRGKRKAMLNQRDFIVYGIPETSVKKVLTGLCSQGIIKWSENDSIFSLNFEAILSHPTHPRLINILSKNLSKDKSNTYEKQKEKLCEKVSMEKTIM